MSISNYTIQTAFIPSQSPYYPAFKSPVWSPYCLTLAYRVDSKIFYFTCQASLRLIFLTSNQMYYSPASLHFSYFHKQAQSFHSSLLCPFPLLRVPFSPLPCLCGNSLFQTQHHAQFFREAQTIPDFSQMYFTCSHSTLYVIILLQKLILKLFSHCFSVTGPGIVSGIQCFSTCSLDVSAVRKSNRLSNLVFFARFSYLPSSNTLGLNKNSQQGIYMAYCC